MDGGLRKDLSKADMYARRRLLEDTYVATKWLIPSLGTKPQPSAEFQDYRLFERRFLGALVAYLDEPDVERSDSTRLRMPCGPFHIDYGVVQKIFIGLNPPPPPPPPFFFDVCMCVIECSDDSLLPMNPEELEAMIYCLLEVGEVSVAKDLVAKVLHSSTSDTSIRATANRIWEFLSEKHKD